MSAPPRLLTLPPEALDGYAACLQDVLALLDRVGMQPAIAHAPALRLVLEDRAALLPGLRDVLRPQPTAALVRGPLAPDAEAAVRAWHAANPAPELIPGRVPTDDAAAEAAQEGLADAVAEATPAAEAPPRRIAPHPNSAHHGAVWTEERKAFAREHGPRMPTRDLRNALNRLAGPPIASVDSTRKKLREMGVPTASLGPAITPDMSEEERTAARAEQMRLTAVASGLGDWTEARIAILRADYDSAPTLRDLLGRINALPGNPIASVESMSHKARHLGLTRARRGAGPDGVRRMNEMRAANRAAMRAAGQEAPPEPDHIAGTSEMVPPETAAQDLAEPTPEPPPQPAPEPPSRTRKPEVITPWIKAPVAPVAAQLNPWASTNPYRLTEEAEAEALSMLRQGQGAKALHEDFGGRLEWWQRWAGEKRQEGRAA